MAFLLIRSVCLVYYKRKEKDGWGSGIIDRIARDIQNEFLGIEGFSRTNMGRMRAFYLAYSIYPQAVGKLEELPVDEIEAELSAIPAQKIKRVKRKKN